MSVDSDSISYGRYLQSIRLRNKIPLEKVSQDTRIGLPTLRLIEQEDHENLPADVFVKGFLRAFARAIGADETEAVRRYESRLHMVQRMTVRHSAADNPSSRIWWKLLLCLTLLFGVICASVYTVSLWGLATP